MSDRVTILSPVPPRTIEWLKTRATVVYEPAADDRLARQRHDLHDADLLIVRSNVTVDKTLLDRHPRLRAVIRAGSGIDNIGVSDLARRGIELIRLGGRASAPAVAELALCLSVALLRDLPIVSGALRDGIWLKEEARGRELAGSDVAIWGYGPVGRAIFDLSIRVGARPFVLRHWSTDHLEFALPRSELVDIADLHIIALPLTDATFELIDERVLTQMAERAPVLVNVGRWELVSFSAALAALRRRVISGYAVDPVEPRHIVELPPREEALNLIISPHVGAATAESSERIASKLAVVLERVLQTSDSNQGSSFAVAPPSAIQSSAVPSEER